MASYFSSLLTTTTSRVATLRQNLLPSENDGDTVDDTHLCRVLRGYYAEKGRNLPDWLPPDPKAPPPVVQQPVYTSNVGASYGGGMGQQQGGRGSSLSSLWDTQPPSQHAPPPGLRGARSPRPNPFNPKPQPNSGAEIQARPLPSQRAGSYQTANAGPFGRNDTPPGSSGGLSAKQRLAGRVGGRSQSPAVAAPFQSNNNYTSSRGGGDYEDRFMPPAGGYGGGRSGGDRPFVAATSPWASNESEFGGGGYNGGYDDGGGRQGGRQGLPSGPGAGRKGPGLPSGPRGHR